MRAKVTLIAVLALGAMLVAAQPSAGADAAGTIVGHITAGTAGGPAIGALEVRLHTFAGGTDETAPATVGRTDASGAFTFERLATDAQTAYVVTTEYQDVEYASDVIAFTGGQTTRTVELAVYETTDVASAIRVRQQHLIVTPDAANGVLRVVEIAVVENGGDRTFVGGATGAAAGTIRLQLPADAYDVDFAGAFATNASLVDGGVAYDGPVVPGQTQLVVGYVIDYAGAAYSFQKVLPLPTDAFDVLVDDVGLSARSAQLSEPVKVTAGDKPFLRLTGKDLRAGSVVVVQLSGAAGAPAAAAPLSPEMLAPLGLLALAGGTAYLLIAPKIRRPKRAPATARRSVARAADEDQDDGLPEE